MEKIPKIHDKFFKQVFSHKAEMQDFIQNSFPKEIIGKLDFGTLELDSGTYIDNELKENFSDLVYHCEYNRKLKIKIALLFEHKSQKPDNPHFQILTYILRVWKESIKQNKKPVFVLPIIFYHGKEIWNYEPLQNSFECIDKTLLKYLPSFDYIFIDVSKIPDNVIDNFDEKTLRFLSVSVQIYL